MKKSTYVGKCEYGLGLFAGEDIRKDEVWWKDEGSNTLHLTEEQYQTFLESAREESAESENFAKFIGHFSSTNGVENSLEISLDNSRYVNHSKNPNSGWTQDGGSYALRDIKKGEQIFENYYAYPTLSWQSNTCRDSLEKSVQQQQQKNNKKPFLSK